MRIWIDTSPLESGHATRGVGMYTRELVRSLKNVDGVQVLESISRVDDADIAHIPYFDLFFSTLPKRSKPTVLTIHDVIPLQFPAHYPVGLRGKFAHWKQKKSVQKIASVVTDSLHSKHMIHQFLSVPLEKISVVYLAGNPRIKPLGLEKVSSICRSLALTHPYVLYVGDINYNKNVPELIKSFRHLPNELHLVLVGNNFRPQPIPEWEAIERQIAAVNMESRTHFLTTISKDDLETLSAVYQGSICYVQPSLEEGFGLPVLEAQQAGTPVVASNCPALMEIGGESVHFVSPVAEDLAAGIKAVMALSAPARNQLIQRGKEHADTFSWKKTAMQMVEIYKQLLR